jgi:FlaA1/EpsC-like NDP-sugar epimerase
MALSGLGKAQRRSVMIAYDGAAMFVALWLAFSARLGVLYWPADPQVLYLAAASVACGLASVFALGLYRIVVRYFDVDAALPVAVASGGAASVWLVLAYFSRIDGLPRSVGLIYFGLLFMLLFFGRLAVSRFILPSHGLVPVTSPSTEAARSVGVAIYGANPTGLSLAESLRRHPEYQLRFFISDSPMLVGRKMAGHRIRPLAQLAAAVKSGEVQKVLLAMPAASRTERLAIVAALSKMAVQVMTIPSPDEIMSGRYTLSDIRPINVDDLLKRDIVPPIKDLIEPGIESRSILVTGAGGSIGSEICRQVVDYGPVRLVLLDHSEFALYRIEREIRRTCYEAGAEVEIVPVVGSLLNRRLVDAVLRRWRVDTVFHAAAYKHVPLIEQNEVAGVENNVFGTKILADACVAAGIARLTMISTDKAVRPTNVMGASKRVAELYIQALARLPDMPTRFGMVRFGNVLDSSGSVVEQFRDQIRRGGPVTVTDPEITRFFMSIPEATQLVLQANSLAAGGEVFVLDMGEPVRIADLAKTMIALAGMTERTSENSVGDIEITYVGLRPGEKLHEELFIGDSVADTVHPQIKMARERCLPLEQLSPELQRLQKALEAQEPAAVRVILDELLAKDHERTTPPVALPRTDARVA